MESRPRVGVTWLLTGMRAWAAPSPEKLIWMRTVGITLVGAGGAIVEEGGGDTGAVVVTGGGTVVVVAGGGGGGGIAGKALETAKPTVLASLQRMLPIWIGTVMEITVPEVGEVLLKASPKRVVPAASEKHWQRRSRSWMGRFLPPRMATATALRPAVWLERVLKGMERMEAASPSDSSERRRSTEAAGTKGWALMRLASREAAMVEVFILVIFSLRLVIEEDGFKGEM